MVLQLVESISTVQDFTGSMGSVNLFSGGLLILVVNGSVSGGLTANFIYLCWGLTRLQEVGLIDFPSLVRFHCC